MTTPDHDSTGDDQTRLEEAMRELDALPPHVVRQAILDAGLIDPALDALADAARNASDPAVRAAARRYIAVHGLGLILSDDGDPPLTTTPD